jgi:GNAT superfamily N-acetyltransferase
MNIRAMHPTEADRVVELWHITKKAAYPYLPLEQERTLADDTQFFVEVLLPRCTIWVAEEAGQLLGFIALRGSYVDRLYILPSAQKQGVGSALINQAKLLSPHGLELHTHQKNCSACAFYAKHGFVAVRFGLSPPPESEPDVEYHWRPSA